MSEMLDVENRVHEVLGELSTLWREVGFEDECLLDRKQTVYHSINDILTRMLKEEKKYKSRLLDSLEKSEKTILKLRREMGISGDDPVYSSQTPLLQLYSQLKSEVTRLESMKEERMVEVRGLQKQDEELCCKLSMDPFYISSTTVPTSAQLEGIKDHIKRMEELKFEREEQFIITKNSILSLYTELEEEPASDLERMIACEDTEHFTLSASNLSQASEVLKMLKDQVKKHQKEHMLMVEKLENLYERLRLDMADKYKFLSLHQGHGKSVLTEMKLEIERLEEVKKANIEQFIINLRNELHDVWDKCFFSPEQRNAFKPLHSIDFTEELLEAHEEQLDDMKCYHDQHKDLFKKVSQRQQVWAKFMELERRSKDPSRLMNSRGNNLLKEERERSKVNKDLPRIEEELHELIGRWEAEHGKTFKVEGVSFAAFIEQQKEDHLRGLEMEKMAREKAKKENLLHETRFGAKPSTPAKLRHNISRTPAAKTPLSKASASTSRLTRKVSSAVATLRSPRAGKIGKGVSPRLGGDPKSKKFVTANKDKLMRGILSQSNYTLTNKSIIKGQTQDMSLASTVPDYAHFKRDAKLNSTEAMGGLTPEVVSTTRNPSYMTPTASSTSRLFKTPSGSAVSRSRLGTPKSSHSKSTPQLSRLRSGKNLPILF